MHRAHLHLLNFTIIQPLRYPRIHNSSGSIHDKLLSHLLNQYHACVFFVRLPAASVFGWPRKNRFRKWLHSRNDRSACIFEESWLSTSKRFNLLIERSTDKLQKTQAPPRPEKRRKAGFPSTSNAYMMHTCSIGPTIAYWTLTETLDWRRKVKERRFKHFPDLQRWYWRLRTKSRRPIHRYRHRHWSAKHPITPTRLSQRRLLASN